MPLHGEHVTCKWHGPQVVFNPRFYTVACKDCSYTRHFSVFEVMTSDVKATKHAVINNHRVTRTHADARGTIDQYGSQPKPIFTVERPPF